MLLGRVLFVFGFSILITFIFINCDESSNPKPADQLEWVSSSDYIPNFPFEDPKVCVEKIKKELAPGLWQHACERVFYCIPPRQNPSLQYAHLNEYDRQFPGDTMRSFTQLVRGENYNLRGMPDSAKICLEEAYNLAKKLNWPKRQGDAIRHLGNSYFYQGDYVNARKRFYEAFEIVNTLDSTETDRYFNLWMDLAEVYAGSKDYWQAVYWHKKAWEYSRDRTWAKGYQILSAAGLARSYLNLNMLDSALTMAQLAVALEHKYHHYYQHDVQLYTLAQVHQARGDCPNAKGFLRLAVRENKEPYDILKKLKYTKTFGEIYLCMGMADSAEYFLNQALITKDTSMLADIHEALGKLYEQKKDFVQAFQHARLSRQLNNRLFRMESARKTDELSFRDRIAQSEKYIATISKEKKISELRTYLILTQLLLVIVGSFYFFMRQSNRKAMLEQEKQLLQAREQLQQQQLEISRQEIQEKDHQLEQSAKLLMLKNRFITELELRLSVQADSGRPSESNPNNLNGPSPMRGIRILTDDDWQRFRNEFEQSFPGFTKRLKAAFPELTPSEIRLFFLMKLGFDKQEIADALGISIESVWKNRYRLRKKIGITKDNNFDLFVQEFT